MKRVRGSIRIDLALFCVVVNSYQWEYERCKRNLNINLALTLFGFIGGSIHALVCLREFPWYMGS